MTLLLTPGSLIQSNFITDGVPNFEAVLYWPNDCIIQHYYRENDRPDKIWKKSQIITDPNFPALGPAAFCQNDAGRKGNFELVVPEKDGLAHYWRDNDNPPYPWHRVGTIAPGSDGPGVILKNRRNGDFEVVVLHGRHLIHYWARNGVWYRTGQAITTNASGPAALIQSSYDDNLELVVQEGQRIALYYRSWKGAGLPWQFGGVVTERATGAPAFIQGKFGVAPHYNFEVVYPLDDRLKLSWRDNSPTGGKTWKPGGIVTWQAGPINAVAMTRGSQCDQIDIIAQECEETVYQYYRFEEGSRRVYMRNGCLRIHEGKPGQTYPAFSQRSFLVKQLTGPQTANPETNILGTDLGASFEHNSNLYFLFGDTHWQDGLLPPTADVMAYTPDTNPWNDVSLYFHRSFMSIRFPGQTVPFNERLQGEYDVPLDGFSFRGRIFAFFSTNHFYKGKVMGRSVLVRCDEPVPDIEGSTAGRPLTFQYLTEFSRYRFINVSIQYTTASRSQFWGLPYGREGLIIWGAGAYRMDNIYLAFMPLDFDRTVQLLLGETPFDSDKLDLFYFCGLEDGRPQWCGREEDAVPLFYPAAVGELSVRWDDTLNAFVMMYMSGPDDPIGPSVQLRLSRTPWGPWSERRMAFNWVLDGLGYRYQDDRTKGSWFIHVDCNKLGYDDHLGDNIIGGRGPEQGGAAYAPYQIPRFTSRRGRTIHLFYALSTWNPYQTMLMQHTISDWDRFVLLSSLSIAEFLRAAVVWVRALFQHRFGLSQLVRGLRKRFGRTD